MTWNEQWADSAACKGARPDELFVRGAAQNRAKQLCGAVPGADRVPRGGSRQQHRVGRLGRDDRARAPCAAAPPPERHLLAHVCSRQPASSTSPSRPHGCERGRLKRHQRRAGRRLRRGEPPAGSGVPTSTWRSESRSCTSVGERRARSPVGTCRVAAGEPSRSARSRLIRPSRSRVQPQQRRVTRRLARSSSRSARCPGRLGRQADRHRRAVTRLSTRPASGICSSASRSTKNAASRSASASGEAITTKAVWRVLQDLVGLVGPSPEAAEQRVERGDERLDVAQHLPAEHLGDRVGDDVHADDKIRAGPLAGTSSSLISRPSRNDDSRSGASRKSSADRDGGVSTTIRSHRPLTRPPRRAAGRASPSPCTPACRRTSSTAPGRRGCSRICCAFCRGRVGLHDLVERALHVEHHRVEAAAGLARRHPSTRAGRVVELGEPHGLGQPACWVDGQDDGLASLLGGAQCQRAGRRGLADATRAAAHDDPYELVGEQRIDVEGGYRRTSRAAIGPTRG